MAIITILAGYTNAALVWAALLARLVDGDEFVRGSGSLALDTVCADPVVQHALLQGFAHPVSDLSRGASVDDIVRTAAVMSALI